MTRTVICPTCGGDSVFAPQNIYRPFCSARCKGLDFGAWASESFRVPAAPPPEGDEAEGGSGTTTRSAQSPD